MEHLESQLQAQRLDTHRNNLLTALRLSVQTIVDQACFSVIDDDCEAYQQLCVVLEHIMMFGYRGPETGSLLSASSADRPRHFWNLLEMCVCRSRAMETIRQMDGVKSGLGKCRAWIMTSLVQKSLAQDFKIILGCGGCIMECYEEGAILRLELSFVVSGLLVALQAVDFCLCLRGNPRLDTVVTPVINYSLFMHAKRSFAGQLSDEDELRRSRLTQANMDVAASQMGITRDCDETDGSDPQASTASSTVAASSGHHPSSPSSSDTHSQVTIPAATTPTPPSSDSLSSMTSSPPLSQSSSSSTVTHSHMPFNSALTMEGTKEFVSLQRQLTEERNQRRYLEDVMAQRDRQHARLQQEVQQSAARLTEFQEETNQERQTMQNIIVELNEKLCSQERALSSLLARYEVHEGAANDDIRTAIRVLRNVDDGDDGDDNDDDGDDDAIDGGGGPHGGRSPVKRNVKAFFSRIGKTLKMERKESHSRHISVGLDAAEMLDMSVEEGFAPRPPVDILAGLLQDEDVPSSGLRNPRGSEASQGKAETAEVRSDDTFAQQTLEDVGSPVPVTNISNASPQNGQPDKYPAVRRDAQQATPTDSASTSGYSVPHVAATKQSMTVACSMPSAAGEGVESVETRAAQDTVVLGIPGESQAMDPQAPEISDDQEVKDMSKTEPHCTVTEERPSSSAAVAATPPGTDRAEETLFSPPPSHLAGDGSSQTQSNADQVVSDNVLRDAKASDDGVSVDTQPSDGPRTADGVDTSVVTESSPAAHPAND